MNIFRQEAEALSKECNMKLYRTSVKDDLNVGVVFQHLAENYVNKVISSNSQERQQESLSIGRRKPAVDFQNKFKLNSSDFDKVKTSASVMLRGRPANKRASPGHRTNRFSNYCDPCTDYLNNPMFHTLHTRGRYSNYSNYSTYWPQQEKTITLRPSSAGRRSNAKTPCRVL